MDSGEFKVECSVCNLRKNKLLQRKFFHAASRNGIARRPRKKHPFGNATRVSFHGKIGEQRHHKSGDKFADATVVYGEQKCLRRNSFKTTFGTAEIGLKKRGTFQHTFSEKSGAFSKGTIPIKI